VNKDYQKYYICGASRVWGYFTGEVIAVVIQWWRWRYSILLRRSLKGNLVVINNSIIFNAEKLLLLNE